MSQDAEQPRSRRELRRLQFSEQHSSNTERGYPSVPLLPQTSQDQVPQDQVSQNQISQDAAQGQAPESSEKQPGVMTRQQLRAQERARHAAAPPTIMSGPESDGEKSSQLDSGSPGSVGREPGPGEPAGTGSFEASQAPAVPAVTRRRHIAAQTETIDSLASLPSRRQLREATITQASAAQTSAPSDSAPEPGAEPEIMPPSPGETQPAEDSEDSAVGSVTDSGTDQRPSQLRARNRAALRAYRELAEGESELDHPAVTQRDLPSRRRLRQQMLLAEATPEAAEQSTQAAPAEAGESFQQDEAFDHESLLEATRNHLDAMPVQDDPLAVDLEVLAEQKKLAERAAILNQRAEARAALAREHAAREAEQAKLNDPTTAHNLAMVTPAQFIQVPGLDRPILKPPATAHVPIITKSQDEVTGPVASAIPVVSQASPPAPSTPPTGRPSVRAAVFDELEAAELEAVEVEQSQQGDHERSEVLRRAARAAQQQPEDSSVEEGESAPLPANSAHGLEPLDALTAGLAQARRARLWQWGIVTAGAAALVVGITLTILTMTR